jgi:hypothetical protein
VPRHQPFTLDLPPTAQQLQVLYTHGVLRPEQLEHGAYYSGEMRSTAVMGRWHAKKRHFVIWHTELGKKELRTIPHVCNARTEDMLMPLSRQEPVASQRISDYAFETT